MCGIRSQKAWFTIGSVEALERNLESVQMDMDVEPSNYVPVIYKTETEP